MKKHVCPECGHESPNPQGLGAHRRSAHGVAGGAKTKRKADPLAIDVMLTHLFPKGIPPEKIEPALRWVEMTKELVAK